GEGGATDAAGFFFPSNADEKRMQPRRLGRVKHGHGTAPRRDHLAIGKADPLVSVLTEELVADSPVALLVLAAIRVNLSGDLRRQLLGNVFHKAPRASFGLSPFYCIRWISRALAQGQA